MNAAQQKQRAAEAAIDYIPDGAIVGVGTGSTVNYFIEALGNIRHKISAVIASSQATKERLLALGFEAIDPNLVEEVTIYIDGADEINGELQMIKGGGAALTGEKTIGALAKQFICIADSSKKVLKLGKFPLPVEVIPMARSYVARAMVKLGGSPIYRVGVTTDHGNAILDVWNLDITNPKKLEMTLNNIPGVVTNGLFAHRGADLLLLGVGSNVKIYTP